jgi:FtsP/CotA-like multicopper oxidase with cupredoxin domain
MTLALAGCNASDPHGGAKAPGNASTGGATGTSGTATGGGTPGTTRTNDAFNLVIPPELPSTVIHGQRVFELTVQASTHEFYAGQFASTLGYNGDLLGPTIRARRGESIAINVTNTLTEDCTTHWHGMHLPADMDGGPHQTIAPGATLTAEWVVDQEGATLWYHPHSMGKTAEHVYEGLAGLFYIDDDVRDALDLPSRYGIDDIPLVLQDRKFTANGQLDYSMDMMEEMSGIQGDVAMANGTINAVVGVEAKQIRFRILNGCNARFLRLALSDGSGIQVIAGDCSLLEAPVLLTELSISPGERTEIVLDLTNRLGDTLQLKDLDSTLVFLDIHVDLAPVETTIVPVALTTLPRVDPSAAVLVRPFVLTMGMDGGGGGMGGGGMGGADPQINGVSMEIGTINEIVPLGQIEIWEITNDSTMNHNFHMHGGFFEVVERNGGAPRPSETGHKDTVRMLPEDVVRLVVQFVDYADEVNPYMYHCHVLEHEDAGMMGQFVVVDV